MDKFKDATELLLEGSPQTASVPSQEYLPTCPPFPTSTDAVKNVKEKEDTHSLAEDGSSVDQAICLSSETSIQHGLPHNGKMAISSEKLNETGIVPETDTTLSPAVDNVLYPNTSLDQSSPMSPKSSNVSGVDPDKYVTLSSEDRITPGTHLSQTTPISLEVPNELETEMENTTDVLSDLQTIPCSPLDHITSLLADIAKESNTVPPPHLLEEGCSDRPVEVKATGELTASDEIRKTEISVNELNHYRVDVRSMQNESTEQANSPGHVKQPDINRGTIDTAAPFESVKEAVTKFGEIVDWKAYKAQTMERRKQVQLELESIREEIPNKKQQAEAVEEVKTQVLNKLDTMRILIEELKLNLERAQTEEAQAKQDSELAQLRVKEIKEGIAEEASIAARTQLEVAKTRHQEAVTELKSVKKELEEVRENLLSLLNERDTALRSAEVAISTSKEREKTVENLTLELISLEESVDSAHAVHLEAEEHRIGAALARDQDCFNWERELDQAKEKLQKYNEEISSSKILKEKLEKESTLLLFLESELAAYMEARLNQESQSIEEEKGPQKTHQELEEIKVTIEKAKNEVNILRVAASSLKTELEKEKSGLASMRQREGMASIVISSLEAEIERTKKERKVVLTKEKEAREKMVKLPKLLQQAAQEADRAKSGAQSAKDELRPAKEEAEQAKATASTAEIRLHAALKEIEAAKASEKLALLAIKALQESEGEDFTNGVTLPLEEYYSLSKKSHEAEQRANEKVISAIAQIEVAKESELKGLQRLEKACRVMNERKETLRVAKEKAEKAKEEKLSVEQELRKWRAENGQRRRASDAAQGGSNPPKSPHRKIGNEQMSYSKDAANLLPEPNVKVYASGNKSENHIPEVKKGRKKSFFPRLVMMLLSRK